MSRKNKVLLTLTIILHLMPRSEQWLNIVETMVICANGSATFFISRKTF